MTLFDDKLMDAVRASLASLEQQLKPQPIQFSKDIVKKMRQNNDNGLYKSLHDVFRYGSYVWENGKLGYFEPFSSGLRFAHVDKHNIPQNYDIVISGFGVFILKNWEKNLKQLCGHYTNIQFFKRDEQWKKENYPNESYNRETALRFLNELFETERNNWEKATISNYFTSDDNKILTQCMETYFEWFEGFISELVEKPKETVQHDTVSENQKAAEPQYDKLKQYFIPAFKGMGMGNGVVNYFDNMIAELKTERNAKEIAEIAYMAYNGNKLNQRKPDTFRTWHKLFCECLVLKYVKYDPNKLKNPNDKLKGLFNYLQ